MNASEGIMSRITHDLYTYDDKAALAKFVHEYVGTEAECLAIWEKMQILQARENPVPSQSVPSRSHHF